uniref:Secreted protein n=1 Tax=Caenorhabditis tropicalis TaxID=1561998 RepID=A0A1I7TIN0_9PELO
MSCKRNSLFPHMSNRFWFSSLLSCALTNAVESRRRRKRRSLKNHFSREKISSMNFQLDFSMGDEKK